MANEKAASTFWSPENRGDTLEGKFVSWQETQYGIAMKIEEKGGTFRLLGMSTVLFNLFKEHWQKMKAGIAIKVVYEGKKKRANIFSAYVAGKHLDSSLSFPAAKPAAVKDFFSKDYEFKGKKGKGKSKKSS